MPYTNPSSSSSSATSYRRCVLMGYLFPKSCKWLHTHLREEGLSASWGLMKYQVNKAWYLLALSRFNQTQKTSSEPHPFFSLSSPFNWMKRFAAMWCCAANSVQVTQVTLYWSSSELCHLIRSSRQGFIVDIECRVTWVTWVTRGWVFFPRDACTVFWDLFLSTGFYFSSFLW